jgi:predicted peptidase
VRSTACLLVALLLSGGCFSSTTSTKDFLVRSVTVGEHRYAYRVWLPPHYTKLRNWPVVLYLHGSEERGDDNERPLTAGLPAALEEYGPRFHSIVVIPQCRDGSEWYGEMEQQALDALDATIREFHGDPRRVILTGISMGGAGAWYMARHRGRFAAVAPISGEVVRQPDDPFPEEPPEDLARLLHSSDPYAALAAAIGHTPVWAFHGELDPIIPATESRRMVEELRAAGDEVLYTEYRGGGHDAWDDAYSDPQFVQWMLTVRARP